MAYWRWWRRRRWPRRRWRRWRARRPRRLPRRRYRRPARRYRRRRVRRRRARGWRGRPRRRGYRRRLYIRRKRKKLTLKIWQPQNVRKCRILGLLPILICGHTRSCYNYALHSDDKVAEQRAFGGGLSTVSFSLKVLYDQNQRGLNRWTYPNDQLDLARYTGCYFYFYRDKDTDFIVQYDVSAPFKLDKNSSPSYHPAKLMQAKHKILIPSFTTRPKGRELVKVKIQPPKMFIDKWYTQEDLCPVILVSFAVTAASFRHPFCSPLTANPCVTFQVLKEFYNGVIGYSSPQTTVDSVFNTLYTKGAYFQSHLTPSYIQMPAKNPDGSQNNQAATFNQWANSTFKTQGNVHYNFTQYNPDKTHLDELRKYYFTWLTKNDGTYLAVKPTWTTPTNNWYEYHVGLFSPLFLSPFRSSGIDFPKAFVDVTYNPLTDKGVGNMMWYQYNTKADTQFHPTSCKCVLENMPLYCMAFGYRDFIEEEIGEYQDTDINGFVCVICPYTDPPMYNKEHPNTGYVFYNASFGNGKWTDGTGFVPVYWQTRWRPELLFQGDVLTDIAMSGPFSYKDELKSTVLTCKYQFNFRFGGNLLYQQTLRNPCKPDGQDTTTHRGPRDVQVVDPQTMGPRWVFHSWDWRRGFLSENALKRLHEKPLDFDGYTKPPKRPYIFPPTEKRLERLREGVQSQEEGSSSEEEKSLISQEEVLQTENLQLQLRKQLREQHRIRQQLRTIFHQLIKTQAGLHINPLLSFQP
nr:MAG: ORF1 [Torque teno virus]